MEEGAVDDGEVICAVLYGGRKSLFVAALALGKQLTLHSSRRRYLLHDDDAVSPGRMAALQHYWNLRKVERISSPESCKWNGMGLKDVFTKLRVLEVFSEGTEVLFLDLDLLLLGNIDSLFDAPSPAGKFHGYREELPDHVPRPLQHGTKLLAKDFHSYTCVNAGVLRLRAGKEAFQLMMEEIERRRNFPDPSLQSFLPEQYLLVSQDWFKAPWFMIDAIYNQEADTRLENVPLATLEKTVITHFSCNDLKPWDFMGMQGSDLQAVATNWGSRPRKLPECDFYRWLHRRFIEWEEIVNEVSMELRRFEGISDTIQSLKQDALWWQQYYGVGTTKEREECDAKRQKTITS